MVWWTVSWSPETGIDKPHWTKHQRERLVNHTPQSRLGIQTLDTRALPGVIKDIAANGRNLTVHQWGKVKAT